MTTTNRTELKPTRQVLKPLSGTLLGRSLVDGSLLGRSLLVRNLFGRRLPGRTPPGRTHLDRSLLDRSLLDKSLLDRTLLGRIPVDRSLLVTILLGTTLFGTTLLPLKAIAQESTVMSLPEIVAYGLEHNNDLRIVRFSEDEARAASNEARGGLLPAIRGSGNYTRLSSNIPDFELTLPAEFGGGEFSVPAIRDRYDFTVSVEQPIFTGFQLLNRRKATSLNATAREQDTRSAEAETAFAIRMAYWDLYQFEEAVGVAQAAERSVEKQLSNTIKRREEGVALGSDVLSLQARLGEVKLAALDAMNAQRIARLRLINVAGLPLDQELQTAAPPPINWLPFDALLLEREALATNPSVQGRALDYDGARASVKAASAGWLPQIFFVGLYQYARPNAYIFPQEDKFTGTWQVGLSAKWDLWNWGQTSARTSQARARANQMAERLASQKRATQFAVREAVMNVDHRRLAMSVAEQNVKHADAAFTAMERRFELGAALTSEVLDAEVANRNARLQQARAVASYGIAQAALLREIGRVQPLDGDLSTANENR